MHLQIAQPRPSDPPADRDLDFVSRSDDPLRGSRVCALGFLGFLAGLLTCLRCEFSPVTAILVLLGATAAPMVLAEVFVNRVHRRATAGLAGPIRPPAHERCLRKLIGFLFTLCALYFFYWLLPEYRKPAYEPVWSLASVLLPAALLLAYPYICWIDARQAEPEDIYGQLGARCLGRRVCMDRAALRDHVLGWIVKGFFLPLMLSFLFKNLANLEQSGLRAATFPQLFVSGLNFVFTLDVTFGIVGYLLTLRLLDAQIRAPEGTALGWACTLVCYPPLLETVGRSYYQFTAEREWQHWLEDYPFLLVNWGLAILFTYGIYVWATVCFGCRFSNLTHRGVITFGPYRYVRHPAYLAKCAAWWLAAVPFVAFSSVELRIQACLLLSAKCAIYWVRARTEERLLLRDPAYVRYVQWIDEHGLWRCLQNSRRNLSLSPAQLCRRAGALFSSH